MGQVIWWRGARCAPEHEEQEATQPEVARLGALPRAWQEEVLVRLVHARREVRGTKMSGEGVACILPRSVSRAYAFSHRAGAEVQPALKGTARREHVIVAALRHYSAPCID